MKISLTMKDLKDHFVYDEYKVIFQEWVTSQGNKHTLRMSAEQHFWLFCHSRTREFARWAYERGILPPPVFSPYRDLREVVL